MKKRFSEVIIGILTVCLVASWTFFWLSRDKHTNEFMIDTEEKAITLGMAYIEMKYPEFQVRDDRYTYVAYIYSDLGEEYWVVCAYDTAKKSSAHLPSASLRKNGEIISVLLQVD